MSILEMVDANFLRDILKQSVLKLIRAANNLDRLLTQVAIMDEYAKAFRTKMWGGYLDSISYIASTSSIAGIYSEGGIDRYIIIKHILQPLLSDARFLRAGIGAIKSQTDKLTFDASNRLAIQNPPNLDVALSTRASEDTLRELLRSIKPNRYVKRTVDLSVQRDNASLISEWGLSGKGPFTSLTIMMVGTGSYTLRFYSTQTDYIELSSSEIFDGTVFDAIFVDLRMTNSQQTNAYNPIFTIDWRE